MGNGQDVGYIRVSSVDQNTARQLQGVELDRTFTEKASAKDAAARPELAACLDYLREGDILHVHSIDRLCRSMIDCEHLVAQLLDKGVVVRFHKENLTFTPGAHHDPFAKFQRQLMAAYAELERAILRERQREGIALAKAAGKYKGRKPALSPDQVQQVRERAAAGEKKTDLAREYGCSRSTIYSSLQREREA